MAEDAVGREEFRDFKNDQWQRHQELLRMISEGFDAVTRRQDIANGRTTTNENRIGILERAGELASMMRGRTGEKTSALQWKVLLVGFSAMGAVGATFLKLSELLWSVVMKHGG